MILSYFKLPHWTVHNNFARSSLMISSDCPQQFCQIVPYISSRLYLRSQPNCPIPDKFRKEIEIHNHLSSKLARDFRFTNFSLKNQNLCPKSFFMSDTLQVDSSKIDENILFSLFDIILFITRYISFFWILF